MSNHKKHILLLTPGFPSDETDSQCIPALQVFVEKLAEQKDIKISIVSLYYPLRYDKWEWKGIDVYSAFGRHKMAIYFNTWKWIQQINDEVNIDIIHSFWLNDAALLGYWIGRLKGIPHINTLMGQDVRRSNAYLPWLPLRRLKTVALSNFHAEVYLKTTGISADNIIPWGLNKSVIESSTSERNIDVIGVGNLIELKAFDQFIRVIEKLKSPQNLQVQIIGDGPEREHLEQLSKDLGLGEIIDFCGKLDREVVLRRMQQSKILLHPSTFESFGLVFLEALENGASIVSRKVGIADVSNRWLLADSEEEFVKYCQFLLDQKANYLSSMPYPIEKTIAAYLKIYSRE